MRYEDELKGKGKKVSGAVKEKLGKALNDPNLHERGRQERAEGRTQETVGRARRKVGEAVEDLGDEIAG
jgi:uncharacterized protein YjbJ (UPF0337 family)